MRGRAAPPHPRIYRIPPSGGVVVSKKTSSVPVNDLIDAQEPKRVAFDRWKASQRERLLFKKTVKKKKKKLHKTKMLSTEAPLAIDEYTTTV